VVVGGRQAANLMTKMTWWCGGIFLGLSLLLAIMAPRQLGRTSSELEDRLRQTTVPANAPASLPITPAPTQSQPAPATGAATTPTPAPAPAPAPKKPAQ
jgi:preprotein translocase subunit SecG